MSYLSSTQFSKMNSEPKESLNILLGVTGSVATIKAAEVVRELKERMKSQAKVVRVKVVTTAHSRHFLPKDFASIGADEVLHDAMEWEWKDRGDPVLHIELVKWADVFVVAPLDACTLAKIVNGQCDNLLTCSALAWHLGEKPLIVCPAMNTWMWNHPSVKANIVRGQREGMFEVIWPISKKLMCGDVGDGAMQKPDVIAKLTEEILVKSERSPCFDPIVILGGLTIVAGMAMFARHAACK